MDYHAFEEAITDFFSRLSHDPAVARSRAQAIVVIAKQCDEEIVGADHGLEMACGGMLIPLAESIPDPHATWPEGALAVETVTQFNREKRLTIDFNSDEHAGGSWLRKPKT
jgi:hypothetical protein